MKRIRLALAAGAAILAATPASAAWVEASSQHFVVLGDMRPEQAKSWAERLERLDRLLRMLTNTPEPESGKLGRVNVYVVPDMDSVQKLYTGPTRNVGGFYHADAQGYVAITPRTMKISSEYITPQQILFHEYTHHILLSSTSGYYPDWTQEGFAEYFSTADMKPDGSVVLGAPPTLRGFALGDQFQMTAAELLNARETSRNESDVDHLYARGWLMIHYLLGKPERAGQLNRYFKLIDSGEPSVEAGRKAFGDLNKLDGELSAHARSAKFAGIQVPASKLPVGPVAVRTLSPCEARIMPTRMVSANGVDAKSAPTVASQARTIAAQCPDDAFVQRTLAEAEFDAGHNDAALTAATRTLALDPGNVMGMIYSGRVAARKGQWAEARQWYIKANRADPNYALPLVLYADAYSRTRQPLPEAALNGLLRAVVLVPQDPMVRLRVGRALIEQGDLKSARTVLLAVAHAPDQKGDSAASKVIGLINAGAAPKVVLAEADKAKWNEIGKE